MEEMVGRRKRMHVSIFMRSIRRSFITHVRVTHPLEEIGVVAFCVSGLRRFSEFSVE